MTDAWDWWSRALEDKKSIGKPHLPVSVDSPEQGFYKVRKKDKPWEPVAIWQDENGEWVALRSGKPYAPRAVWNWCCRNPITAEEYEQALAGLGWDVDDPTVAAQMGHNVGDTDDLTILADQIEAARQGAEAYKDIESEEQAAKAQSLRARMNELAGTADKKREALKKPYFEAGKAVDLQWMPLVKEAKAVADQIKRYIETFKTAQLMELRRLELERQRAEAAAREVGETIVPPPLPPIDSTVKGSYGRAASVRTKQVVTGINDIGKLLQWYAGDIRLQDFLIELAEKDIASGNTIPGVTVEEKGSSVMIEFKERRTFSREDYEPYLGKSGSSNPGLQPLPNAEEVDPLEFLNNLASGGHMMQPVWGYALLPDSRQQQWTQFFLTSYMMSGCDGGGYAVTYGAGKLMEGKYQRAPLVRRFAICKHAKESTGTREREQRGWHPGHCTKCGFNMTYDSGD